MLTAAQRDIIKATIPLLETGGEALTTHMYQRMFARHPEVKALFNQTHQGRGNQPRALAMAVLAYARNIDRLEQLGPLVGQIVAKHVSLNILPRHYPIVGENLLAAIREVLGEEIATDAVIDAWAVAYGQLADLLMGIEEKTYADFESSTGGWRGARPFKVARKVRESAAITSFYLQPADGGPVAGFKPGQYIGVRLLIDGQEVRRNYSLSALSNGHEYRISVKREPNGVASSFLHERVAEGDVVELFPPAGDFTLADSNKPLVLISAGVGITPALTMLEAAQDSGRPIHFIHCARNADVHAFDSWLKARCAEVPQLRYRVCYSDPAADDVCDAQGLLDQTRLAEWLPEDRDVDAYFLGPKPFMAMMKRSLRELGVPDAQARYEFFGPAEALDA
ncbi:NO-inducible flavohemoprotein [Pseudomonas matsuisoli]|uniref:Flavohemoprotein n=1 Tax=Pseudomonas matsuisoli TaxID=1515666 RepID=A0A917PWY5_9PSED|nr:NO-inducible flavohemoprotein [Pseudomonas matsuisoli]GGJ95890.1 flavohemoprotein [Pseudomonas matsuisoli]